MIQNPVDNDATTSGKLTRVPLAINLATKLRRIKVALNLKAFQRKKVEKKNETHYSAALSNGATRDEKPDISTNEVNHKEKHPISGKVAARNTCEGKTSSKQNVKGNAFDHKAAIVMLKLTNVMKKRKKKKNDVDKVSVVNSNSAFSKTDMYIANHDNKNPMELNSEVAKICEKEKNGIEKKREKTQEKGFNNTNKQSSQNHNECTSADLMYAHDSLDEKKCFERFPEQQKCQEDVSITEDEETVQDMDLHKIGKESTRSYKESLISDSIRAYDSFDEIILPEQIPEEDKYLASELFEEKPLLTKIYKENTDNKLDRNEVPMLLQLEKPDRKRTFQESCSDGKSKQKVSMVNTSMHDIYADQHEPCVMTLSEEDMSIRTEGEERCNIIDEATVHTNKKQKRCVTETVNKAPITINYEQSVLVDENMEEETPIADLEEDDISLNQVMSSIDDDGLDQTHSIQEIVYNWKSPPLKNESKASGNKKSVCGPEIYLSSIFQDVLTCCEQFSYNTAEATMKAAENLCCMDPVAETDVYASKYYEQDETREHSSTNRSCDSGNDHSEYRMQQEIHALRLERAKRVADEKDQAMAKIAQQGMDRIGENHALYNIHRKTRDEAIKRFETRAARMQASI